MYIGAILLLNLIIHSSYMLYYVPVRQAKLIRDRSRDYENFRIRKNIQQLAVAGIQMYILQSENLNTKNANIFIPELKDFPPYEWLDKERYKIIPYNNKDTVFTITGIGNVIGDSSGFINANGDTGKVQISSVIYRDGTFMINWEDN